MSCAFLLWQGKCFTLKGEHIMKRCTELEPGNPDWPFVLTGQREHPSAQACCYLASSLMMFICHS